MRGRQSARVDDAEFEQRLRACVGGDARRDFVIDLADVWERLGLDDALAARQLMEWYLENGENWEGDRGADGGPARMTAHGFKLLCVMAETPAAARVRERLMAMQFEDEEARIRRLEEAGAPQGALDEARRAADARRAYDAWVTPGDVGQDRQYSGMSRQLKEERRQMEGGA